MPRKKRVMYLSEHLPGSVGWRPGPPTCPPSTRGWKSRSRGRWEPPAWVKKAKKLELGKLSEKFRGIKSRRVLVAQLVDDAPHLREFMGSSPAICFFLYFCDISIASLQYNGLLRSCTIIDFSKLSCLG